MVVTAEYLAGCLETKRVHLPNGLAIVSGQESSASRPQDICPVSSDVHPLFDTPIVLSGKCL